MLHARGWSSYMRLPRQNQAYAFKLNAGMGVRYIQTACVAHIHDVDRSTYSSQSSRTCRIAQKRGERTASPIAVDCHPSLPDLARWRARGACSHPACEHHGIRVARGDRSQHEMARSPYVEQSFARVVSPSPSYHQESTPRKEAILPDRLSLLRYSVIPWLSPVRNFFNRNACGRL